MKVFGVSFDSVADNKAFADKFSFPFALLSDPDRAMGIAYKACDGKLDPYARRLTYVVGPEGTIEQAIDTKDPGAQAGELLGTF